jgi:uncharacterized protein (DUF1684 family)
MKKNLLVLFYLLPILSFSQQSKDSVEAYKNEIEQWHQNRVTSLKSENGWLNIVGLYWLKEGENTFGSSSENSFVFPKGKADEKLGSFILKDGTVSMNVNTNVTIQAGNKVFTSGIIFDEKKDTTIILSHKNLRWFIIKRGTKYGVRLRDLESDALKNFTHIDRFPVNEKWKITAVYEAPPKDKTIPINDVIGLTTETPFGGTLHFEIDGQKFQLEATLEGNKLFIVFADETTGNETYGGGRFLYAERPLTGTTIILDFNKAYDPPCCFTNFATCPLPTAKNHLTIAISAGEKTYGHH